MKNNIRTLRRSPEFDISQEELAKAIGTTRDRISQIENGSVPGGKIMLRLSKFFNIDIRQIFFDDHVVCAIQEIKNNRKRESGTG